MNHFKIEIIIKDYIENFDKNKLKIELSDIKLVNPDDGKIISFTNKRFFITYTNFMYPIKFNMYILNNSKNPRERIDYLLDEDFEIEEVLLDLYYDDKEIYDYSFNETVGEQVDLIDELKRNNRVDITHNKTIKVQTLNTDLEILLLPLKNNKTHISYKYNCDLYNIEYNNKNQISFVRSNLFDKYSKVEVFLTSKNAPIVLKDLESLKIYIGNMIIFKFDKEESPINTSYSINKNGTLIETYKSNLFNSNLVKSIKLGYLYSENNILFFEKDISFLYLNREDLKNIKYPI